MRTKQEFSSVQPERGPSPETALADTVILDSILQNCGNKLLFINRPVWDTSLQQAGWTKTQVELYIIYCVLCIMHYILYIHTHKYIHVTFQPQSFVI